MGFCTMVASLLLFLVFLVVGAAGKSKIKFCKGSTMAAAYDESMNIVLYSYNRSWVDVKNRSRTERTTSQREEVICPNNLSAIHPPAVKRMCPHYTVVNYDPKRVPNVIFEARCKCDHCLSETSRTPDVCKPVYYFRNVLMERKQSNKTCYTREVVAFSVGCQCVGFWSKSNPHSGS